MSVEQKPTIDPLSEMRVLKEQVQTQADMNELRIQEHQKQMASQTLHVDRVSQRFSWLLQWGVIVGLVVVFVVLFYSISPIVRGVVEEAGKRIDWDTKIETVADAELRKLLTAESLAKVVNDDAIQTAASNVVDSPEFKGIIRTQAEETARAAVTSTVDRMIADTNNFRAIIEEQLRAERERLQAATASLVTISADDHSELTEKLLSLVLDSEKLGSEWTNIDVYPFDDVLHIQVRVWWKVDRPENERIRIWSLTFEGLGATTDEKRETVAEYLALPSVPASASVKPSPDAGSRRFVAGEFHNKAEANYANHAAMSDAAVVSVIELIEDCFGLTYPVTWRVQIIQR